MKLAAAAVLSLLVFMPLAPAEEAPGTTDAAPSGQVARDYIESYAMEYPYRSAQLGRFMEPARDALEGLLQGFGLTTQRHDFGSGVNILGFQTSAINPDDWLVISAHYDTIEVGLGSTIYGAWDNGAGVGSVLALAEAYQGQSFPFTIVYTFFDREEIGLEGSREFILDFAGRPTQDILANINLDPPGLNWPCGDVAPYRLKVVQESDKVQLGTPRYVWLDGAVTHGLNAAAIPVAARDTTDRIHNFTVGPFGVFGTSDHVNFGRVNIANVYIGGLPVHYVGGTDGENSLAAFISYPIHTPLDTLEVLEAYCIQGSLVGGLQAALDVTDATIGHLAANPVPP